MWPRGCVEVQLYSSMTAALEGGEWSAARPGRTLPPGKNRYPFYRRLGGRQGRSKRAENLVPTGIRSRTVQPVVTELPGPQMWKVRMKIYLGPKLKCGFHGTDFHETQNYISSTSCHRRDCLYGCVKEIP